MRKFNTKEEYNEFYRKYMLDRYYKRRAAAIETLGGKCSECGSQERLEFDHINAASKEFPIAKGFSSWAKSKIESELKKCQLLCNTCHAKKSLLDQGVKSSTHGMRSMYTNHGCRCSECKAANGRYIKSVRARS